MSFFPERIRSPRPETPGDAPPREPAGRAVVPQRTPFAAPAAPATEPQPPPSSGAAPEVVRAQTPRFTLDDVILPPHTRERLEGLLGKVEHHRELYEDWDFGAIDPDGRRVAINLYGPPGTGKSMCAEALASRMRKQLLCVSYAELESKYVGETPKNIVAAFAAARAQDALLFFDEADSILGRRLTSVTQSADHGVNVSRSTMLLQLDRFEGIVVFATNLARNYDGAFVRRILGHVELGLPDAHGRTRLSDRFLRPRLPRHEDVTSAWLAAETDGLAGGELKQIILNAATRAVRRQGDARRVSRADLAAEIEVLRHARRAIGLDPGLRVREDVLDHSVLGEAAAAPASALEPAAAAV